MASRYAQTQPTVAAGARVLGVDANNASDPATTAPCAYRETNVYPYFVLKGFTVDKFQGPQAERADVAPAAVRPGVVYITASGHGNPDVLFGHLHQFSPVFQAGAYSPEEPAGKIVHLMSCTTSQVLGPDLVRNGCLAFFGYSGDFLFPAGVESTFFECDSEIDRAFADGLTAAEVYARVRALFETRASEFLATLTPLGNNYWSSLLELLDRLQCPAVATTPNQFGSDAAKLT